MRFLDIINVAGKLDPIKIYEVYDHNPDNIKAIKHKMEPELNRAFLLYKEGDLDGATAIYTQILHLCEHSENPDNCFTDPLLHFYLNRCQEIKTKMEQGLISRQEWFGLYNFTRK